MSLDINHTHDANARSWVESANRSDSDFPIQNLRWACAFSLKLRNRVVVIRPAQTAPGAI